MMRTKEALILQLQAARNRRKSYIERCDKDIAAIEANLIEEIAEYKVGEVLTLIEQWQIFTDEMVLPRGTSDYKIVDKQLYSNDVLEDWYIVVYDLELISTTCPFEIRKYRGIRSDQLDRIIKKESTEIFPQT